MRIKNRMYRVFSILLLVAFSLLCIPTIFSTKGYAATASDWTYQYNSDSGEVTITKYNGSESDIVVPAVINGCPVTAIGDQAFTRNDSAASISIPDSVTSIGKWAIYDYNGLQVVTIAGVLDSDSVASDMIVSSNAGGVMVYTVSQNISLLKSVGFDSDNIISDTDKLKTVTVKLSNVDVSDPSSTSDVGASYAPMGKYLVPSGGTRYSDGVTKYEMPLYFGAAANAKIASVTVGSGSTQAVNADAYHDTLTDFSSNVIITVVFSGKPTYDDSSETKAYADGFSPNDTGVEYNMTFRILNAEEAAALNETNATSSGYSAVAPRIVFEAGYYINGTKVTLADDVMAYDVNTGNVVYDRKSGLGELVNANSSESTYQYIGYQLTDDGSEIQTIYYSPYGLGTLDETATIQSTNTSLNGITGRLYQDPIYRSFVNSVITADGESIDFTTGDFPEYVSNGVLTISSTDVGTDGNSILAENNEERSLIHATNGGTVITGAANITSTSMANNAKMSYENNLSSYNEEIAMQWGMNAAVYATQGGTVIFGDPTGAETSYIVATGESANGAVANTTGDQGYDATASTVGGTSSIYVYNTVMDLQGWNNHVADTMYGGYVSLNHVTGTNGIRGSYAVGQSGTITNDFGDGVVDAENVNITAYGNRTAGSYVIGGGIINISDSALKCYTDGGAVIASGGTFHISNSTVEGVSGLKLRGGNTGTTTSTFDNVSLIAKMDYTDAGYVYGDDASAAVAVWKDETGSNALAYWTMSSPGYTLGELAALYNISNTSEFLASLSEIAGETYTSDTLLRNSVLDNTLYNYSGGIYTNDDHSSIPYLTPGPFGGLTSAVLLAENGGGEVVEFNNCQFTNENAADFQYLIASEASSVSNYKFIDTDAPITGIIWNEGTASRTVDGRPSNGDSYINVAFENSDFEGNFADGDNGLWTVSGLSYTNGAGETTSLNGNYYGGVTNWGITASFDSNSSWLVTGDSYIGSLTIASGATITVPDGEAVSVTVNGVISDLDTLMAGGTFTNVVITLDTDGSWKNPYADVSQGAWYYDAVEFVCENGLMNGMNSRTFCPDDEMTRGMLATVLYRLSSSPSVSETSKFADVGSDTWYSNGVVWASSSGIVSGTGDNEFSPNQSINREQLAVSLYQYAIDQEINVTVTDTLSGYLDSDSVSSDARDAMAWAVQEGLISGTSDSTLSPLATVTRAEAATSLSRFAALYG